MSVWSISQLFVSMDNNITKHFNGIVTYSEYLFLDIFRRSISNFRISRLLYVQCWRDYFVFVVVGCIEIPANSFETIHISATNKIFPKKKWIYPVAILYTLCVCPLILSHLVWLQIRITSTCEHRIVFVEKSRKDHMFTEMLVPYPGKQFYFPTTHGIAFQIWQEMNGLLEDLTLINGFINNNIDVQHILICSSKCLSSVELMRQMMYACSDHSNHSDCVYCRDVDNCDVI